MSERKRWTMERMDTEWAALKALHGHTYVAIQTMYVHCHTAMLHQPSMCYNGSSMLQ